MEPDPETLDLNWDSEDVVVRDEGDVADVGALPAVTVYADLPVPKAIQGTPAGEAYLSPFLLLTQLVGDDTDELMGSIEALRALRERVYPALRRASVHLASGDFDRLGAAVAKLPGGDIDELSETHPVYHFGRRLDLLYMAFAPLPPRLAAIGELGTLLLAAETLPESAGRAHLTTVIATDAWNQHRRRVVDTVMKALGQLEALIPALAWEHVELTNADVDDFQVMRDDFDELKAIYQDVFELGSRTLAFMGTILNVVHRGDARAWGNGERWTLETALRVRALDREFVLEELPHAREVFDAVDRHTRNQIGHRLIAFDFAAQSLVDGDGRTTNYLLFLVDYLGAVRLTNYLIAVIEKITIHALQGRVPQREAAGLPIASKVA